MNRKKRGIILLVLVCLAVLLGGCTDSKGGTEPETVVKGCVLMQEERGLILISKESDDPQMPTLSNIPTDGVKILDEGGNELTLDDIKPKQMIAIRFLPGEHFYQLLNPGLYDGVASVTILSETSDTLYDSGMSIYQKMQDRADSIWNSLE